MITDHIGPGSGVARNYYYYPGDGFGFGYGFGVRTDPATPCRRRRARLARSNGTAPPAPISWSTAPQDMFFVLLQNAPSSATAC